MVVVYYYVFVATSQSGKVLFGGPDVFERTELFCVGRAMRKLREKRESGWRESHSLVCLVQTCVIFDA